MNTSPILVSNISKFGGRRKTPTILQMEETECGAACLAMILAHFGRWVPLEELRIRCGVSRDGSKASNILRAAREYGLTARGFRREPDDLHDLPFPMIIFWKFNHFVVLEGFRKQQFYINDPAEGQRRVPWAEFDKSFTGVCLAFTPEQEFQRGNKPKSVARSLLVRMGSSSTPMVLIFMVTLLLVVPGLAIPVFMKTFIDDVLIQGNQTLILTLVIGLGMAAIAQAVTIWLQQISIARLEVKLSLVNSEKFFKHVLNLPVEFFGQRYVGDIVNRIASNDTIAQLISGQLTTNFVNILTMIAYAAVILVLDPILAAIVLVIAAVNVVALQVMSKFRDLSNRRMLKEKGRMDGETVAGIRMIETLKASGTENSFFTRWTGMHAKALQAQHEIGLLTTFLIAVPFLLHGLSTVTILGIGGIRILDGALTVGGLIAFQMLAWNFLRPIEGLVKFGAEIQTVKGEIARLDDVLNYQPDPWTAETITVNKPSPVFVTRGFISIDNITFGYNQFEAPLIKDFNLRVEPGQRIVLTGSSGSGKSTVAKLICGLLQPWSGTISVDGCDIRNIPRAHLAQVISYVDQEVVLFKGNLRDNISLWNPTISNRDMVDAVRDAALQDTVDVRPGHYNTIIEELGNNFSGGQKQRIEIARALALDPVILVLDEATAALDPITEHEIDLNIRKRGCTCFIVAHRLSTVRDANEIIVLEGGSIVQRGRHEDLYPVDGVYRTLIISG